MSRSCEGNETPSLPLTPLSNEQRLQHALATGGLGLWEVDVAARLIHGSASVPLTDSAARQASFSIDEFMAMIESDFRPLVAAALDQSISQCKVTEVEYRIMRPDGAQRWIAAQMSPVVGPYDTVERLIAFTRDITALKQAEAEREELIRAMEQARRDAERSVRQRDSFISSTVHDLHTPLTYIRGRAQLLGRRLGRSAMPEVQRAMFDEGIAQIIGGVDQLANLMADLRDVMNLQLGQPIDLKLQPTEMIAFVRGIVSEFDQQFTSRVFEFSADIGEIEIEIDPVRIRRIISNLLANAVKYSGPDSTVRVHVGQEPEWVRLSVEDQGIGIPVEDLERIFERYQRGSNVRPEHDGSGIGLAGVRAIANHHGGNVTVDSTVGVGSIFTVRLPRRVPRRAISTA